MTFKKRFQLCSAKRLPICCLPCSAASKEEFERWQQRDLSARRYVYIWADGVYLQARMEVEKQCILVLIGATPEGRKELIGFQTSFRESGQS